MDVGVFLETWQLRSEILATQIKNAKPWFDEYLMLIRGRRCRSVSFHMILTETHAEYKHAAATCKFKLGIEIAVIIEARMAFQELRDKARCKPCMTYHTISRGIEIQTSRKGSAGVSVPNHLVKGSFRGLVSGVIGQLRV